MIALLAAGPAVARPDQPASDSPAPGGDGSPTRIVTVSWTDVAGAVDQHPAVAAGRFTLEAARGAASAAAAVPNPSLEATAGEGRAVDGDNSDSEWSLALSVPFGWVYQRGSKVAAAEGELDVAAAESRMLRRNVLLELRILFWQLVYEQARVASLEALEEQTAVLVSTVRKRVEVGEVRPVDAPRVEIELERVAAELEAARTSLAARQAQLALWLGVPAGATVVAAADLSEPPAVMDLDTALEKLRASHPGPAAARGRIRTLEATVSTEKRARLPAFSLTAFESHELDRDASGVGLTVDVPLWSWNRGRIAQAQAELEASRLQAEATSLELESALIEAEAACRAAAQTAKRLGSAVVPRSESATATMERTYQLGEASLLELIDARRTLLDTRRQLLGAFAQAQIECSRLSGLVGEEIP